MSDNLLQRLETYSLNPDKRASENFTTEVVAYLINSDKVFRRIFIRVLSSISRRVCMGRPIANTQKHYGNGIVDLVLSEQNRNRELLIEVKLSAQETVTLVNGKETTQIRKYLDYGSSDIACLCTHNSVHPDVDSDRYLGCIYFENLYVSLLGRSGSLSDIGKMFLEYMEENQMVPIKPFTKSEICKAQHAFSIAGKCKRALEEITALVEPDFKKLFHTHATFTRVNIYPRSESVSSYSTLKRNRKIAWVELWIQAWESKLNCGVTAKFRNADETRKINRKLKWDADEGPTVLLKYFALEENRNIEQTSKIVVRDLKKLASSIEI